ncbi:DUF1549 and DUF1553 domain-containing protein [Roseimaritima sediminicola]|uniref:DUF1549 and DUF1553 domain-containing protein n=1 Tax=Roseimaritima sediminicola TaxID=2662066 RepID=UPI001386645D|nr:DUF1549 and DUF1553 domain-containing protein [Roseimaritima sediminicola]
MKTLLSALALVVGFAAAGVAEEASSRRVDFRNDLIPMFTKNGCNAGACHGAAIGRGGFKLSLYGGDPASDYEAIVRQRQGRRIHLLDPAGSLIYRKPAEYVQHGGGAVFEDQSESARLLLRWIEQGASPVSRRELVDVAITPAKHVSRSLDEPIALRAVAHYADGSTRDVTRWTIFKAEDASAVAVDPASATTRVLRPGRHIVIARYLNTVVPIELVVPLAESTIDLADEAQSNFIDQRVLESLAALGLSPSPVCDDATYLRRVSLDLTGRLPSPQQVRDFLDDDRADKRRVLVDRLLEGEAFQQYWTLQLAKLLRISPPQGDQQAAQAYHRWVADQVKRDASYRQLARTLILASGDTHVVGPANFYRTTTGPREQAEFVSELFMGSRLRCANCHNHPLDRWTQDDYHGLAAVFAKVEQGETVRPKPDGQTIHPRTLEPAAERIPGEFFLADSATDGRQQFADWLTDPANPYFAKAIVNRLWQRMMGRGLVEPVDDFRDTNPATHPVLLDQLAEDFIQHGYRLRRTLRLIANSTTYARSANATAENKDDDRFYSHALRRPLEAEVLADAISDVLGVADRYGDQPVGTRAVTLVSPATASPALDILGRCDRSGACESSSRSAGGLPQKLHLFNGDLLNARIAAEGGRLERLRLEGKRSMEVIQAFYLAALSRPPTNREREHWQTQLNGLGSHHARQAFLEDFVWGLLTCEEFVTNH